MTWIEIELDGVRWEVAPRYIAPVSIGEAIELARANDAQIPTTAMVDAIWRAADLKLAPIPMANRGDNAAQFREHARRIEEVIDGRSFRLLAGTHKDVVICPNGRAGIYGWHVADELAAEFSRKQGIPLYAPATPGRGRIIQGCNTTSHDHAYKDYSQGLRIVRRAGAGAKVSTGGMVGAAIGGAAGGVAFGWPGAVVGAVVGLVGGHHAGKARAKTRAG